MIVKTNKKNDNGRDIYENALTGQSGTLNEITVEPSLRSAIRKRVSKIRVRTNRKSTLGRFIYFQQVNEIVGTKEVAKIEKDKDGNNQKVLKKVNIVISTGRVIKHVQESPNALKRKIALFNFFDRIEILKSKWHKANPEYQKKAS